MGWYAAEASATATTRALHVCNALATKKWCCVCFLAPTCSPNRNLIRYGGWPQFQHLLRKVAGVATARGVPMGAVAMRFAIDRGVTPVVGLDGCLGAAGKGVAEAGSLLPFLGEAVQATGSFLTDADMHALGA